jgi:hypothetical protein
MREIHLVGSLPLEDVDTVFRTIARFLGSRARRIPDGEVASRLGWLRWQRDVFARLTQFRTVAPESDWRGGDQELKFSLNDGVDADAIDFGVLGYAEAAASSYAIFSRLKGEGVFAKDARFQVSLPTPYAVVNVFVERSAHASVEPHYERAMKNEIAALVAKIPAEDLAIQWDVAQEIECIASGAPQFYPVSREDVAERLVRLVGYIPEAADAGIHFCYGDKEHRHFIEPVDTREMVETANRLTRATSRSVNWFHMPVPRERVDDAYYAPLRALEKPEATTLFLGLVHYTDGLAGTLERIAIAQRHADSFGIATECGMGRRPPETIESLLRLHAVAASSGH